MVLACRAMWGRRVVGAPFVPLQLYKRMCRKVLSLQSKQVVRNFVCGLSMQQQHHQVL